MSANAQKNKQSGQRYRSLGQHAANNGRGFPWVRATLAALLAVLVFTGTSAALMIRNLDHQVKAAVIDTSHLMKPTPTEAAQSEEPLTDDFAGRPVNIMVVGIDSRYGDNGNMGAGTADDEMTIRSDTTMVVHLSADRTRTTVVSIPRDLMTQLPDCTTSDGTQIYAGYGQFNDAFAYGAGTDDLAGGVACTQSAVQLLTGLNIDGFVVVDFAGLEKLIDALGGVEICLDQPIYDIEGYTNLDLPAGCQKLNGVQGLDYARARHVNNSDGSDLQRIDRQQKMVGAIIKQALNTNLFTDLPKLYAFIQESLQIVKVSSSLDSLRTDAALLNSVRGTDNANFRFITMPWVADPEDMNRVLASDPEAANLFASLVADTPLPIGTIYRDLDNHRYIIADDGSSIMIDEEGNHVILDANGQMIPSPEPVPSVGTDQSNSTTE